MKAYKGLVLEDNGYLKKVVLVHDIKNGNVETYELPLYLDEVGHSPTGFNWGYGGAGPSQLAYAILRDHGLSPDEASRFYGKFKEDIIRNIPMDVMFLITSDYIDMWLDATLYGNYVRVPDPLGVYPLSDIAPIDRLMFVFCPPSQFPLALVMILWQDAQNAEKR